MNISVSELPKIFTDRRTYVVKVAGNRVIATVTSTPSVVRFWIYRALYEYRFFADRLVIGVGVQWRPSFRRGCDMPAATLQLCIGHRCLIFQLLHADYVPAILRRLLSDASHTFVGIWNHSDARRLLTSKHVISMRRPLDLRLYVKSEKGDSMACSSIEEIVREYLDWEVTLDAEISRSNWNKECLSDSQVGQACADAYLSFEIGKRLKAWKISESESESEYDELL